MSARQSLFTIEEEQGDVVILHYKQEEETSRQAPTFKQRLVQWLGRIILLALGAAVFAASALHIPGGFRPWIFLSFILWAFAFCSGTFNP